jgi:hypothetical protein
MENDADHYQNLGLCRERAPLGTGPSTLGTACHRWAGKEPYVESQVDPLGTRVPRAEIALGKEF